VQHRNVRTSLRPLHLLTDVGGDGQQRTAALRMETAVVGSAAENQSLKRGLSLVPASPRTPHTRVQVA